MSNGNAPQRGVDDPRIARLLDQAEESHRTHVRTRELADDILRINGEIIKLRVATDEQTEIMRQVRDILTTFRGVAIVAKWIGAIGAATAGVAAAWHNLKS